MYSSRTHRRPQTQWLMCLHTHTDARTRIYYYTSMSRLCVCVRACASGEGRRRAGVRDRNARRARVI